MVMPNSISFSNLGNVLLSIILVFICLAEATHENRECGDIISTMSHDFLCIKFSD